jgi:hypothetical protein
LLASLDLEVLGAFVLFVLVAAFSGIFSLHLLTNTSITCAKQSNARIDRARTQHSYHQLNDEKTANSRSGRMSC